MLYLANVYFGTSIGGLMDPQYIDQPWTVGKLKSVLEHLWIPVIVIGTAGTAAMIRRFRPNLLDELEKQYVVTGRAKGLPPGKLLRKYPLRMALNFFVSDIGTCCPASSPGPRSPQLYCRSDHRPVADRFPAEPGHVSCRFIPDVSGPS
ncbi:MAG: hypothetical protein Ct9H300mP16_16760 [Pseudomonadota bacterium]|nr:MAG: hypothetical protein Ct9H300mP16_16760 [Pseudomonadota bacterium]